MRFSRTHVAATATVAALGLLAAVALASGSGGQAAPLTPAASTAETDPAPIVRTVVIRKTIHRKAKARPVAASRSAAPIQSRPAAPATAAPAVVRAAAPIDDRLGADDFGDDHGGEREGEGEDD